MSFNTLIENLKNNSLNNYSLEENINNPLYDFDTDVSLQISQEGLFSSIKESTSVAVKALGHGASITEHTITAFLVLMNKTLSSLNSVINNSKVSLFGDLDAMEKEIDSKLNKISTLSEKKVDSILITSSLYDALLYNDNPDQYFAGIKNYKQIISSSNKDGFLEWLSKNRLKKITEEVNHSLDETNSSVRAFNNLKTRKLLIADNQINDYLKYTIYDLQLSKTIDNENIKYTLFSKKKILGNKVISIGITANNGVIRYIYTQFYTPTDNLVKRSYATRIKSLSASETKELYSEIKSLINLIRHYAIEFKEFDTLINHSIEEAVRVVEKLHKKHVLQNTEKNSFTYFFAMFYNNVIEYMEPKLKLYQHLNKTIKALYTLADKNYNNLK